MEAKTLRSIVQEKGIKQSWIAEKLKVSKGLVTQWMKETTPISAKHQTELKKILS